jgi:undecaprenyl-diphosphatase
MEDILRAIVLGIIQGLTEFLPISSSGHLIIARDLFDWEFADDLTFDVALHLGTTVAVLVFFRNEWLYMIRGGMARIFGEREEAETPFGTVYDERLLWLLVIGSIPTAIVGATVDRWFEDDLREPVIAGVMLIVFGVVLYVAERLGSRTREIGETNWHDAVFIGLAQAISLVPGTSRSGVTISAGMFRGFTRTAAARFSFLLLTPAIVGAGLLKTAEAINDGIPSGDIDIIVVGAVVSAIVGFLSIGWLLRLVQSRTYLPFVVYRLAMGTFVIMYFST